MKKDWNRQNEADPLGELFIVIAEMLRRSGAPMPEKREGGPTEEECQRALCRMRAVFYDEALTSEERARGVVSVMRELVDKAAEAGPGDGGSAEEDT